MSTSIFLFLESTQCLFGLDALTKELVVTLVVLFGLLGEDFYLCVLLLSVSDAYHLRSYTFILSSIQVYLIVSNQMLASVKRLTILTQQIS